MPWGLREGEAVMLQLDELRGEWAFSVAFEWFEWHKFYQVDVSALWNLSQK